MSRNFGSRNSLFYSVLLLPSLTSVVALPAMGQPVDPTSIHSAPDAAMAASTGCKVIVPDATDGVLVAPQNHKVIYETGDVPVIEVTVTPHTREIMHTHARPAVMYLDQPGASRMYFPGSDHVSEHAYNPNFKPIAIWLPPEELHAMENTGDSMFHSIRVEFKHPGCSLSPGSPVIDPGPNDAVKIWPEGHRVLFENEDVRVLDVRNAPHAKEPFHTHWWPGFFYVVQGAPMKYSTQDGAPPIMLGVPPVRIIPLPPNPMHSVENLGDREAHFIRLELKHASSPPASTNRYIGELRRTSICSLSAWPHSR